MSRGLRRFYVDRVFTREGDSLCLSLRETFHLHRVLRLKTGDACRIFNRNGQGAEAVVEAISEKEGAQLRLRSIFSLKERSLFLKVGQALPQKRKMDELVEKGEELALQELWVLETQRSVKMQREARERTKRRWERIVIEAAKQSGSPLLMRIEGPLSFEKVIGEKVGPSDPAFLFHPDPQGLSFSDFVEKLRGGEKKGSPSSCAFLFFGPEGGFSEEEVLAAESRGIQKVFLGDSTLRVETAFLGVISALRLLIP